jgi:L-lactate utilization protein LutC
MSIFKKFFKSKTSKEIKESSDQEQADLPLDQVFVNNFLEKKGKFLYCTSLEEVSQNLNDIIKENNWETILCKDSDLLKLISAIDVEITSSFSNKHPFFVTCEHLIAENGSILLSSNQLGDIKISGLSENFIVYATTSQLVKTKGESLTGIKSRYKGNIPSNISPIKNYDVSKKEDDFMNYGNTNSKNLYLLLFEDL